MNKKVLDMFLRYALILIVAIPNLWIFYLIFTPITLYVSYFLLDIFFSATISGSTILINNCAPIEIINACTAGSAYYLLFLLNLSTPRLKRRFTAIIFSFSAFFLLNIIRVFILSLLHINASQIFYAAHKLSWYSLSILFVIGIWFLTVRLFSIKDTPFYTDLKFLYKKSTLSRN